MRVYYRSKELTLKTFLVPPEINGSFINPSGVDLKMLRFLHGHRQTSKKEALMIVAKRLFIHHDPHTSESLVINSVTGAVDIFPTPVAKLLEERRGTELSPELLAALGNDVNAITARGYVFPNENGEEATLRDLYQKYIAARPLPVKLTICPTFTCNLACVYCFEGKLTERKDLMSPAQLDKVLEATELIKQQVQGPFEYELFGGEPLLPYTRDIVGRVFAALKARSTTLMIVSNGTHVEEFLPLFRQYRETLDSIQITVDGPPQVHDRRRVSRDGKGSFDRIAQGVDKLLAEGIMVRLRVNVDQENLPHIPELLDVFERREWTLYQHFKYDLAPVSMRNSAMTYDRVLPEEEIADQLLHQCPDVLRDIAGTSLGVFRILNHVSTVLELQRNKIRVPPMFTYCEATAGRVYVFGPDGLIYGCPDAVVDRRWAIGEYWPDFRLDETKRCWWLRDIFSIPQCHDCEIATFCGGGCALVGLDDRSGRPNCNRAQQTMTAYLTSWFERRRQQIASENPIPVPA